MGTHSHPNPIIFSRKKTMHQTTPSYPASPTHRFRPNDEYDHCLTRLSNLHPSNISWLWPSRLPLAQISLLVARPGLGKSLLTADLAARISTASPWPDGSPSTPGSVLFICGEDDPAQVLRPRLLASGADLTQIHHLNAAQYRRDAVFPEVLFNLNHHQPIHNALEHLPDCKLVVIDSIGALLGSTGSNLSTTVHSIFAPLAHMANRFGPAFLLIAHTRKQQTTHADELVLGSRAFTSIPHNIWHVMRNPKTRAAASSSPANPTSPPKPPVSPSPSLRTPQNPLGKRPAPNERR